MWGDQPDALRDRKHVGSRGECLAFDDGCLGIAWCHKSSQPVAAPVTGAQWVGLFQGPLGSLLTISLCQGVRQSVDPQSFWGI